MRGLQENVGRNGVCSNYAYEYVNSTWECLRNFQGGNAIFTMPSTAIKCGGAPQKIMYLAEDYFRRQGIRDKSTVIFASPSPAIFSVAKYKTTLERIVQDAESKRDFDTTSLRFVVSKRKPFLKTSRRMRW